VIEAGYEELVVELWLLGLCQGGVREVRMRVVGALSDTFIECRLPS